MERILGLFDIVGFFGIVRPQAFQQPVPQKLVQPRQLVLLLQGRLVLEREQLQELEEDSS
jgi:hypothetical protein